MRSHLALACLLSLGLILTVAGCGKKKDKPKPITCEDIVKKNAECADNFVEGYLKKAKVPKLVRNLAKSKAKKLISGEKATEACKKAWETNEDFKKTSRKCYQVKECKAYAECYQDALLDLLLN